MRIVSCCEKQLIIISNKEKMMRFGYARTSTVDQNLDMQIEAIKKLEVDERNIFVDQMSGAERNRPRLQKLLSKLIAGDTLVIWKFDRLARSMTDLLDISKQLQEKGVELISITENIDTNTPMGKFTFHLMGALGQFERDLTKERINAGIANARAKGKILGRPRSLNEEQIRTIKEMKEQGRGVMEIARILQCSRYAIYRVL